MDDTDEYRFPDFDDAVNDDAVDEVVEVVEVDDVAPVRADDVRFADSDVPVDDRDLTRGGRLRKWDRPPPPHDWRWYVGNLGKTLITVGLLMFGFVAYQLWGTSIETAAAQSQLEDEFTTLLAGDDGPVVDVVVDDRTSDVAPSSETPPDGETSGVGGDTEPGPAGVAAAVPVDEQNIPAVENGDALARIEIPRIGLDDIVVAGVDTADLKKGPGHFSDTPLPGQLGNAAIAGHRTTYGQPFFDVDKLQVGDEIRTTTLDGVFVYRVTGQQIVSPSNYEVVSTTDTTVANLTLTSCHPKFTARQRIIITSELDPTASAPVGEPVLDYGRPDAVAATADAGEIPGDETSVGGTSQEATETPVVGANDLDVLGSAAVNDQIADAFGEGWFSDPGANLQVGVWGVLLSAIAIGAYLSSRRLRRDWAGLLAGVLPFAVALYFFFQNVNRLLPPNL